MDHQPHPGVDSPRGASVRMADLFPSGFDQTYFCDAPWSERVKRWVADRIDVGFSGGNEKIVRRSLEDSETGLRVVVNITAVSLLVVFATNQYLNLYDRPRIGGKAPEPSEARERVDKTLKLGQTTYFGAVALGGTGVRYYGEYCMVLNLDQVADTTRLFDRDSFDILEEPLFDLILNEPSADPSMTSQRIDALRGVWGPDRVDMAVRRVLPELGHDTRLVTSGTISDAVFRDQEFIEVHLDGSFEPNAIEEVRESPDETAIEMSLRGRADRGIALTQTEQEWLVRREIVVELLAALRIPHRIVTLHGRGYQWA